MRPSNIYVLDSAGITKIGVADNLKARMAQYQMHNPMAKLVWSQAVQSRKTALAIESKVKSYYRRAGKGASGSEWFTVPTAEVQAMIEQCLFGRSEPEALTWEEGPFGVMVFGGVTNA